MEWVTEVLPVSPLLSLNPTEAVSAAALEQSSAKHRQLKTSQDSVLVPCSDLKPDPDGNLTKHPAQFETPE